MTVVHPNHIVGINSITVQTGDSLSVHKADGSLIRTIVSNTGVSTFHAIEVSKGGGDLTVGVSTFFVDNSTGKIGIGTVPARTLQVFAATPQVNLKSAAGGTCELQFGDTGDEVRANIIYNSTDNYLGFNGYNNTERLRINSAGTVRIKRAVSTSLGNDSIFLGIGDVENGTNVNRMIGFGYVGTFGSSVYPASMGYTESDNSGNTKGALTFNTRNTTGATDVPVERLRINSSGQVLIGGTSSVAGWGQANRFQVQGNDWASSGATIAKLGNNSNSPNLVFTASRGTSVGTVVQDGDRLGYITFTGDDGTDVNSNAAKIYCEVDGTPGSNDLPGRLIFSTASDGADSATERLRIDSAGNMSLGKSAASSTAYGRQLQIHDPGTTGASLHLTDANTGSGNSDGIHLVQQGAHFYHWLRENGSMYFATNNTEKLRIGSYGEIKFTNSTITERMHYDSGGGITGNYNHSIIDYGMVWFGATNPVAAWTMNIRGDGSTAFNDLIDNNTTTTFTQIVASSDASKYMTAFKIDGTTQTVEWAGGSAPSAATASGFDSYVITIFKSASNTYKCFGNFTNFN